MGSTITEKILARAGAWTASRRGTTRLPPRLHDRLRLPRYTDVMFRQMKEDFGIERVKDPERYVLFIDHMTTRRNERELEMHNVTRDWGRLNGVEVHEGVGIGHQARRSWGTRPPGSSSSTSTPHQRARRVRRPSAGVCARPAGGLGTGAVYLDVPASTRFHLEGAFAEGVDNRDLLHHTSSPRTAPTRVRTR